MKSIWMINHSSHTPETGKWTRHYHLAQHLVPLGWTTRVITASVDRHGVDQPLDDGEAFRHVPHEGFSFTYLRTPAYRGHGIGRVRNMLVFMFRALSRAPHAGVSRPDVIVGCTVHPFAALAGALLAQRYGVPFIFEVRDLWPETLIQFGLTGRHSLYAVMLGALERFLFGRADRIISTLPDIQLYLKRKGLSGDKVRWITNGIDCSTLPGYSPPPTRDTYRLLYIGSLAYSYGLETLVESMGLLQEKATTGLRVELHLLGDGELRMDLERRVRELNLENVRFLGSVPRRDVSRIAADADAFVMLVRDLPDLYCYGISMNKLTEYLAIGRPIVISVGPGINNMVAEAGAGLTVPPEQPGALAEAFLELSEMPRKDQLRMGELGRDFAHRNLDYAQLAVKYQQVLAEFAEPVVGMAP